MSKMKSHRGAAKRFKPIAGGKGYKHRQANRSHILTKKSPGRKRRLSADKLVDGSDLRAIARLLIDK